MEIIESFTCPAAWGTRKYERTSGFFEPCQVPNLTQDTNWKVTNSQLDTTNKSQEVSPFPAGDHKAHTFVQTDAHKDIANISLV